MIGGKAAASSALSAALRLRRRFGLALTDAVCVYDLAERMGIEVRFLNIPSLEGMYWQGNPPRIFLPSDRPAGRQTYNCAHEIGHHVFKHGIRIDQVLATDRQRRRYGPDELLADMFAGFLLMPKTAVSHAFAVRQADPNATAPADMYRIACWFGVGYTTLIHHMRESLGLLKPARATVLLKDTPKTIRRSYLGEDSASGLVVADERWTRPVDLQVGDVLLLPDGAVIESNDSAVVEPLTSKSPWAPFRARRPGITRASESAKGWAVFVRVSRRAYEGRSIFRHIPEDSEDD